MRSPAAHQRGAKATVRVERLNGTTASLDDLDASFLARTASVVRDWRHFFDQLDVQSSRLQRSDRTLASRSRTLDANFDVSHPELGRFLSGLLGSTLPSKRGALATALEATRSRAGPAQRVAFGVGNGNRRVVERRVNVSNAIADVAADTFFLVGLCHRWVSNKHK